MNNSERDELRAVQDRWLKLPWVQHEIRTHGEESEICGPCSPTYRDVRTTLMPDWREWFNDFFM